MKSNIFTLLLQSAVILAQLWAREGITTVSSKRIDSISNQRSYKENAKRQTGGSPAQTNFLQQTDPQSYTKGMIDVRNPSATTALTVQASGDGIADDTVAIQTVLDHAANGNTNKVYFPPGTYKISRDLDICGPVELHGSRNGVSVIKASTNLAYKLKIGNTVRSQALRNVVFKYLLLDGVRLWFKGGSTRNKQINVQYCVFFSSEAPPTSKDTRKGQLRFLWVNNSVVKHSLFLRDRNNFGVGSKFNETHNVSVEDNVCGLDLVNIDWLSTELNTERQYWTSQRDKLVFLKSHFSLSNDQGYFESCLYDGFDTNMIIRHNIFNGSPRPTQKRDHVVYLKGFIHMRFAQNYARGWPASPAGGVKVRDGDGIILARNYIDGTGILLYSHGDDKAAIRFQGLKNVVVYGNHLVVRNTQTSTAVIRYMEILNHSIDQPEENLKYSGNEFEIVGLSDPTNVTCIYLGNVRTNLNEHHVYSDNVYYGYTPTTTVGIHGRPVTPSLEPGNINPFYRSTYGQLPLYEPNIPTYT